MSIDKTQAAWFIGLVACICGAVVGQAELIGEPWRHYVSVLFIAATAASGYMLQPPRNSESRERVNDPPEEKNK